MTRAHQDDESRFERIVDGYGPALGRIAAVYAPDDGSAEDLLQDILLAVWRALPSFRGECSERTFVFRIAHNRGITHRNRRRSHERLEDVPQIAHGDPGPEARLDARRTRERLLEAVRRLPDSQRQVVMLHLEGLSHREIADVVGITDNNVAVRLSRARRRLRGLLTPEESGA